jgi:hypothetical protein
MVFGAVIAAYGLGTGFVTGALLLAAALPIIARAARPLGRPAAPPE